MRTLVETRRDISWLPQPGEGRLFVADELPPRELCKTAFGFVFDGERVLLTRLRDRDWDIPGGHIDTGESPEQAAVREVWEETSVRVEIIDPIGFHEVEIFAPNPADFGWSHPISVQVYFRCRLIEMCSFEANSESSDRAFFEADEAERVPTMREHLAVYREGLRRARLT